jgi:hypothetical protein
MMASASAVYVGRIGSRQAPGLGGGDRPNPATITLFMESEAVERRLAAVPSADALPEEIE